MEIKRGRNAFRTTTLETFKLPSTRKKKYESSAEKLE